jgi:hypothetical protein
MRRRWHQTALTIVMRRTVISEMLDWFINRILVCVSIIILDGHGSCHFRGVLYSEGSATAAAVFISFLHIKRQRAL